jgi:hydroxymethylpyrimidine pyrophosphatase-like HAD family hydrolase
MSMTTLSTGVVNFPLARFSGSKPTPSQPPLEKVLLLSDLDGTWLHPDPAVRQSLDEGIEALKARYRKQGIDLRHGYVTARSPELVMSEKLPQPQWTITHNGAVIHQGAPMRQTTPERYAEKPSLAPWRARHQASGFQAERVLTMARQLAQQDAFRNLSIKTIGEVVQNDSMDRCPFITTLCIENQSIRLAPGESAKTLEKQQFKPPQQVAAFQRELARQLSEQGVQAKISSAYPFNRRPYVMFDIAAPDVNKGAAVNFVLEQEKLSPERLIVAVDGGNDLPILSHDDGRWAIVVGGEKEVYAAAAKLKHHELRPQDEPSSLGVLRGAEVHLNAIAEEIAEKPATVRPHFAGAPSLRSGRRLNAIA